MLIYILTFYKLIKKSKSGFNKVIRKNLGSYNLIINLSPWQKITE